MNPPETRYARAADGAYIAYQLVGDGPPDLVYVPGWNSHVQVAWENPLDARFLQSLASFTRLILVDRRGSGLSDSMSIDAPPSLELRTDDFRYVLDAVGGDKAVVFGVFEGGPLCAFFAATHPARTSALVLYGPHARGSWAPDYPWAWTDQEFEEETARSEKAMEGGWDEDYFKEWMELMVPSLAHDERCHPWLRRLLRSSGTPGSMIALARLEHEIDIRALLPTIQVPTLVINRVGDRAADFDEGRWVAGQIPGASFVSLPGDDHPPWAGDQHAVLEAISRFLGVRRPLADVNRVLATVLFIDIVDSTRKAVEVQDAGWKDLLAMQEERANAEIARHGGTLVDTAGDGLFAMFDGPARAVRCAQAIGEALRELGLEIRAGCHTGEVELAGNKVRGIAVHIGARVAALAGPGEVFVSSTVKDLVAGSGIRFEARGEHHLKGVPDRWRLYRVVDGMTAKLKLGPSS